MYFYYVLYLCKKIIIDKQQQLILINKKLFCKHDINGKKYETKTKNFKVSLINIIQMCIFLLLLLMSKSSSELVSWFSKARHEFQLQENKAKLPKIPQSITNRRAKLASKGSIPGAQDKKKLSKSVQDAQKFKKIDDHRISLQEFAVRYNTDLQKGLTEEEAAIRLEKEGQNKLTEKQGTNPILDYFHHMAHFFGFLMWAGAILSFILYALSPDDPSNLYLGIVLVVIINLSTFIEFSQNRKSKALMESFKNFAPPEISVIRGGVKRSINSQKLVRGDLIQVETGKKIPADIRVVQSNGMKVDNSSLTGQTDLLPRTVQCTNKQNPLQTKNVAFFSTLNKQGSGIGVVMFTGDRTFIGQIASLALSSEEQQTPLNKEINRFVKILGFFAVVLGIAVFGTGLGLKFEIFNALALAIGITVSNVPNGLLLEITLALTMAAKRLSKKQVLAKNLKAVQTLGSTTCICSDKTGTLTMNKMIAANLWYNSKVYKAANKQKEGNKIQYQYDVKEKSFLALQQCASVCSVAIFDRSPPAADLERIVSEKTLTSEQKSQAVKDFTLAWAKKLQTMLYLDMPTIGDASQSALIKFFQPIGDVKELRCRFPVLSNENGRQLMLLFSSVNKFAFSINKYPIQGSQLCLFTKGAPQKVWAMCTHVLIDGVSVLKTQESNFRFKQANERFGKGGQRVLGFAKLHLPSKYNAKYPFNIDDVMTPNFPLKEQTFVGIVSLNDPPRDSVPFSVTKCHTAGVKVIMVTGDQPVTAAAIARQCNIISSKETVNEIAERMNIGFDDAFHMSEAIVIHGDQITKMTLQDEGLPEKEQGKKLDKWLEKKQIVFARTSPAQKLIIVSACQKRGDIVAVTGDGVNDSPAIKKADLGIAMGIVGTDVAKDAASMVLLNDDFSSIITGIEEGRKIFDNLKKAIMYVACSQTTQILPFVILLIIQIPPPISAVLVLAIDLGTDLAPAISFAYQQAQLGIMTRKPRSSTDHLVTSKLFLQGYGIRGSMHFLSALLSYFIVFQDFGFPASQLPFTNGLFILQQAPNDIYNPSSRVLGNSNLIQYSNCTQFNQNNSNLKLIDWLYSRQAASDLRMSLVKCIQNNPSPIFTPIIQFSECRVQQISPISNRPICYTTEAAKYAQSSYFYANIVVQILNNLISKSRRESVFSQGMANSFMYFGITVQLLVAFALAFVAPVNVVFGSRDCLYFHFGVSAIPTGILIFFVEEVRKYLIRTLPRDTKLDRPNWCERITLW